MSNYTEALSWAAGYCSKSEHCKADVLPKLEKYELSNDDIQKLLAYLQKEGYLNEHRYAKAYALDQFRFHRWGRIKIRYALQQKNLPSEAIAEALSAISESDYKRVLSDLLKEKYQKTQAQNDYELAAKMLRFAYSKGFEPEYVKQCMDISDD